MAEHESIELRNRNSISAAGSKIELKRVLGLYSAVNLILGIMIGSGIFVTPAEVLKQSGSVGLCLIIWNVSAIISLLGALAFAELGTVVPESGAEYAYYQEAFGKLHKFWGPLPAFICAWIYVIVLKPAEVAIITMTFAKYAIQPMICDESGPNIVYAVKLVSLLALFLITYINISSVKLLVKVQNVFGVCKVFTCFVVVGAGIYVIARGNTANLASGFEGSIKHPVNISMALIASLWAYDGWNSVTTVTEEVINPAVNVPLSIAIAVPVIAALYVFMNVAYMTVLDIGEMKNTLAVGVAFGNRALGPVSFIIPLGVAIANFGCAMSIQFSVTRVCFTASKGGHMLNLFSFVNMRKLTPAPAVAFQALLSTILIITVDDIHKLINFSSWFLWFFYGLAMVALLTLRRTQPDKERPYRVPIVVPCLVLLVAIFLSVMLLYTDPNYFIAVAFIAFGVAFYTVFVYYTPEIVLGKITFVTQVLFESVPPNSHED